jgi:hypothetical protein
MEPYINRFPGDLVTAEDWNEIQRRIKADIKQQIGDAISAIHQVPESENSLKLQDQSADDLTNSILEKARQELPKRTGYQRIFKRLKAGEERVVEHKLGGCPLVDLYELMPFLVVCSEDDQKNKEEVYFYFYHSSERRIRFTEVGQPAQPAPGVEIERTGGTQFRISLAEMLAYYNVKYTDRSTLEDLETEFWQAFLSAPNDEFDDNEYCHSPWFDRCCGERRTVGDLKSRGDWDELWFKVIPRKTVNLGGAKGHSPRNLEVFHYDFNKLGIRFAGGVNFGGNLAGRTAVPSATAAIDPDKVDVNIESEASAGLMNLMVLLKV